MNRIDYSNSGLAALGRNEDSFLAHVAPGEMVVPPVISDKTKRRIDTELRHAGLDPRNYHVGEYMTINPITGMPEFGFLSKVFKGAKKIATAPFKVTKKIVKSDAFKKLAPIAANFIPIPGVGPLAAMAIRGAIGGLASGKGLKGAALGAAMSAAGGAAAGLRPGMAPALAAGTKITPANYFKATAFGSNPFTKIKDAFTSMRGGGLGGFMGGMKDLGAGLSGLGIGGQQGGLGLPSMVQTSMPSMMQMSYGGGNPMLMQTSMADYKTKEFNRLIEEGMDPNTAAALADQLTGMDRFNYGIDRFKQFGQGLGGILDSVYQGIRLKNLLKQRKTDKSPAELVPTGLKGFDTYSNVGDFGIGNLSPMLVEGAKYVNQSPDMAGKGNKVITAEYGGMVDKYMGGGMIDEYMGGGMVDKYMGGGIIDQYQHGGIYDKDDGPGDIAPAMLEPGEFVLTRDAVKGAGGPEVLYPLMAQLEARA